MANLKFVVRLHGQDSSSTGEINNQLLVCLIVGSAYLPARDEQLGATTTAGYAHEGVKRRGFALNLNHKTNRKDYPIRRTCVKGQCKPLRNSEVKVANRDPRIQLWYPQAILIGSLFTNIRKLAELSSKEPTFSGLPRLKGDVQKLYPYHLIVH
jgi:hypothetical protein